jgi:hypothetical protein
LPANLFFCPLAAAILLFNKGKRMARLFIDASSEFKTAGT